MVLRCKCGNSESNTIHKDGLEVVTYVCMRCRRFKTQLIKPISLETAKDKIRRLTEKYRALVAE